MTNWHHLGCAWLLAWLAGGCNQILGNERSHLTETGGGNQGGGSVGGAAAGGAGAGGAGGGCVAEIVAGYSFVCARRVDRQTFCWGDNTDLQIDGVTGNHPLPTPAELVPSTQDVKNPGQHSLGAGGAIACAISETNKLYCRGKNNNCQVGAGGCPITQTTPVGVPFEVGIATTAATVVQVDPGLNHACALAFTPNQIWCWGDNSLSNCGNAGSSPTWPPTQVDFGTTPLSGTFAIGWNHGCALDTGGGAWCWGANPKGQLGNNDVMGMNQATPVQAGSGASGYTSIAAGFRHTCAIRMAGVDCWGGNDAAQLGLGHTSGQMCGMPMPITTCEPAPVVSLMELNVVTIAAGLSHTCAVMNDRTVRCWGLNDRDQCGATSGIVVSPLEVSGVSAVRQLALGGKFSCALTTDDEVWCWGDNGSGQLGNGMLSVSEDVPQRVDVPCQ